DGADGSRLVRRPGGLDGRGRRRRVLRSPAQRPSPRPRGAPLRRGRGRRRLRSRRRARGDRDQAAGAAAAARRVGIADCGHDWGVTRRLGRIVAATLCAALALAASTAWAVETTGPRFAYTEVGEAPSRLEVRSFGLGEPAPRTIAGGRTDGTG